MKLLIITSPEKFINYEVRQKMTDFFLIDNKI
jgi:hypothetical protein